MFYLSKEITIKAYILNEDIEFPNIRVIDAENNHLGIIPLQEALSIAKDIGLDLVLVNPNADNPTAKIADYHKMVYLESKLQKHQKKITSKEIRLRPNVGHSDYDRAIKHAKEFLEDGHSVVFNLPMIGRELDVQKRSKFMEFAHQVMVDLGYTPEEHKIDFSFKKINFILKPKTQKKI